MSGTREKMNYSTYQWKNGEFFWCIRNLSGVLEIQVVYLNAYNQTKKTHKLKQQGFIQGNKKTQKISLQKQMTQQNPIVQNVISFAIVKVEGGIDIDIQLVAQKIQNSRYNKKRFPAVIIRKIHPKSTVLLFKSGKMIIVGSESQKDGQTVANKIVRDVKKILGFKAQLKDFHVTNIVANANVGWLLNKAKIADEIGINDGIFPGVVYRGIKSIKAILIFSSGKVVFTGVTERKAIDDAFIQLKSRLYKYRKIQNA